VALPVTIAPHGVDAGLYGFGITAAFSAGVFYQHSKNLEKNTRELFEQLQHQIQQLRRVVETLATRLGLLRTSFEGWRGRVDVTLEAQDGRITALERHRLESAV
jgi:hypothetical protein